MSPARPSPVGTTAKFKVLCLHGIGTNSEIFEAQTAALRYQLGDEYQYDFLDGAHPWPTAKGIDQLFGDHQVCYSYFNGSAESAMTAVNDLADYVMENGPFDAVMGFSLGAALAATLLLRAEKQQAISHIKSAIFICGTLPCDWDELRRGNMHVLQPEDVKGMIRIPTVHAWSANDVDYPCQSILLMQMCHSTVRLEAAHSAGHCVPSQVKEVAALANCIQLAVIMRFLARRLAMSFWWDDWTILGALVFAYGLMTTTALVSTVGGAGYHVYEYSMEQLEKFLQAHRSDSGCAS
ncbi:hypothetical protein DL764_004416 [Monosporascus ibericus]|uniref:Uncharacterized protein n=1 Tax=Monosporascus ibericus TaxID=155417 RepID=A0A4Q4TCU6_9PEZI|nr:hypothetical protein DL764_004416 [Monosporascus ibericus]